MPFTLAHPAAALLLRGLPLPVAAVVAGTMAPDVPVFLNAFGEPYRFTHSVTGAVTVDLAISLVGLAVWFGWLRDPLVDLAPAAVRNRLPATAGYDRRQWLLAVPAAVLGSLTHMFWDAFTHNGRWASDRIDWLHAEHGPLTGARWAQYTSSVVGLALCALWAWRTVRRRRPRPRTALFPTLQALAFLLVAGALVLAPVPALIHAGTLREKVGLTAVVGTLLTAAALFAVATLWQAGRRILRPQGDDGGAGAHYVGHHDDPERAHDPAP